MKHWNAADRARRTRDRVRGRELDPDAAPLASSRELGCPECGRWNYHLSTCSRRPTT